MRRSPRICGSWTAVIETLATVCEAKALNPVNRKRHAYVSCPMRLRAPADFYPPRGGTQRVRKAAEVLELVSAPTVKSHAEKATETRMVRLQRSKAPPKH